MACFVFSVLTRTLANSVSTEAASVLAVSVITETVSVLAFSDIIETAIMRVVYVITETVSAIGHLAIAHLGWQHCRRQA